MSRKVDRGNAPTKLKRGAEEALVLYRRFINSRGHKRPAPHELDPRAAAGAMRASALGMKTAIQSRYVADKLMKSGMPILTVVLVVFLLGYLLLVPLKAVALLLSVVPGVRREGVLELGSVALTDVLSSVALLLMLMLRSFLHKPIFKCFIHTLRDVNPSLAKQVESSPVMPDSISGGKQPGQVQEQRRPLRYKFARMALLMLLSRAGRRVPVVKWAIAPVMLFSSGERLLGTQNALLLALVGLIPPIAPAALNFLHLWRASHVTGSELLNDYTEHIILPEARSGWFRRNEVAVFCFTAPQLLIMQLPIVGPLLFLPASAAAAFLADYLHRLPYNAEFQISQAQVANTSVQASNRRR